MGLAITFLIVAAALAGLVWHFRRKATDLEMKASGLEASLGAVTLDLQKVRKRYEPIVSVDAELAKIQAAIERSKQEHKELESSLDRERKALEQKHEREKIASESLKNETLERIKKELLEAESSAERKKAELAQDWETTRKHHETLKHEVSLLEENLEDISFGLYKPHFDFKTSETYRVKLDSTREMEKQLVRAGRAATCSVNWTVQGSAREGQRMAKQYLKLVLRAFNGECDAAVTNVTWNNVIKMETRVRKSFEAVNELGSVMQMSITEEYLKLKLDELRLTHEYEEKKYLEKEEQRRIREQIREEEKAQREIQKAREEAEEEEARFEKALARARAEAAAATGEQLEKLTEQIKSLEVRVGEAHTQKERAIARAQLTKSGFVYIISNVGSFGEKMVKIGMTRRMEPMERIEELGDASVPFPFDVHAMLYSDDAPSLEKALHELMFDRRVNLVNPRKEFYQGVGLDEIEAFVREKGLSAQFIKIAEAKEYRETLSLRAEGQDHARPPAAGVQA